MTFLFQPKPTKLLMAIAWSIVLLLLLPETSLAQGYPSPYAPPDAEVKVWGVVGSGLPNLTAASVTVTPNLIDAETETTLSAVITNTNTVGTGAGFKDLFQIKKGTVPPDLFSDLDATVEYSSVALTAAGTAGDHNTATGLYTFPSNGLWLVRACADMNTAGIGSINESNELDNCSGTWTQIQVGPDLTAGNVNAPAKANVDEKIDFSALITNQVLASDGGSGTNGPFMTLFQVATAPNGSGTITDLSASTTPGLAKGASRTMWHHYTFTSTGTYSIRACADKADRNDSGIIDESDEDNNCSNNWVNVDVTECTGTCDSDTVACFTSAPAACDGLESGQTCNVSSGATVTYSTSVEGNAGPPYAWTPSDGIGSYGTDDTADRSFGSADKGKTIGMSVKAKNADSKDTCPLVHVKTGGGPCGDPDVPEITVNGKESVHVSTGSTVTVNWQNTNASTCTFTRNGGSWDPIPGGADDTNPAACVVSGDPGVPDVVSENTTYCITCDDDTDNTDCATANVGGPDFQEF